MVVSLGSTLAFFASGPSLEFSVGLTSLGFSLTWEWRERFSTSSGNTAVNITLEIKLTNRSFVLLCMEHIVHLLPTRNKRWNFSMWTSAESSWMTAGSFKYHTCMSILQKMRTDVYTFWQQNCDIWHFIVKLWKSQKRSSWTHTLNFKPALTRRSCAPSRGWRTCNHSNRRHPRRRLWCCAENRAGPPAPSGLWSSRSDTPEGEETRPVRRWSEHRPDQPTTFQGLEPGPWSPDITRQTSRDTFTYLQFKPVTLVPRFSVPI